ncbi:Gfo/Idh/MocA family protein [Microbacterium sp. NPDC058342]|uniref:Gfo/Idh/MocA family protein n=1 Tax=Microbacterium sp. NPDC058342 TaxID=3346454 RepID=UPI00366048E9
MPRRIAIIGYGSRGRTLAPILRRHGATIVLVVDAQPEGRERALADDPDCRVSADLADALGPGIDAVMILTPDHLHEEQAIAALEAGKAVFCEKPLAITTAGADRILDAAERTGGRLYVGHNMRHMPVIRQMRELIRSGSIGEVKAIWCRHFVGNGGDYYFKDWHAERANTTGLLLQKGAHDIDVIHWLAGGYTRVVSAMGGLTVYGDVTARRERDGEIAADWVDVANWPPAAQTGLHPVIDVEDISMVHMQLDNGVYASYEQCHYTPDYWRNYTVIGTAGRLENHGDTAGGEIRVWNTRISGFGEPDVVVPISGESSAEHGGADHFLIREFLDFAADGIETETSSVAAREAVATTHLATVSLRSGSTPQPVPAHRAHTAIDSAAV